MANLKVLLIRALAVVLVAFVVEILVDGFDLENTVDHLIDTGLPMFLGLMAFGALGPKESSRIHKAMYPALYALVVHFVLVNVFDGNEARVFGGFWTDGILIPIGFILAVPTLYLLDMFWKPKSKEKSAA